MDAAGNKATSAGFKVTIGATKPTVSVAVDYNAISPNEVRRRSYGHNFRRPLRNCIEVRVRHRTVFDLQSVDVVVLGRVSNSKHAIRSYAAHRRGAGLYVRCARRRR